MGGLEWWHIVIIVAVLFVLFGYKKLPSATKSIAQSMKIFKDETKGLVHGDQPDEPAEPAAPASQHPQHDNAGAIAAPAIAPAPAPSPNLSKDPAAVPAAPAPAPQEQPVAVAPPHSLAPRPGAYAGGSQQPR